MIRARGGGRTMNRSQLRGPFKTLKTHVAKPPFDLTACETNFSRVKPLNDEVFQSVSKKNCCTYDNGTIDMGYLILIIRFLGSREKSCRFDSNRNGAQ